MKGEAKWGRGNLTLHLYSCIAERLFRDIKGQYNYPGRLTFGDTTL